MLAGTLFPLAFYPEIQWMFEDYLAGLTSPEQVLLNISDLPRGIDNYHIDVKLSPKFCAEFKSLLTDYLTLETSENPNASKMISRLKNFETVISI